MRFDAIVVGSGPAGSTCAYELSKRGLKVAILEKKKLPRFKICAGCLSARIGKHLPKGWERLVLNSISSGVLRYKQDSFKLEDEQTIAYIIDRSSFDYFLTQKAMEEGAKLITDEFEGFEEEKGHYRVFTKGGSFTCDYLIGADGFYSKTAKLLGFEKRKFYRSLELFDKLEWGAKEVEISIGWVRRGYAWTFPRGEGVSIGIASGHGENLLSLLREYGRSDAKPYGWHIPYSEGMKDLHLGRGRVLLVGDAGNFVDPLLGEGIYYAVLSGKRASESILKERSEPIKSYRILVEDLAREFEYAGRIAKIGYSWQWLAYRFAKLGGLSLFYELLKGRMGYKELYRRGWAKMVKGWWRFVFLS